MKKSFHHTKTQKNDSTSAAPNLNNFCSGQNGFKFQHEDSLETQVQLDLDFHEESADPEFIEPMFDNSDVLFLAKPKKDEHERKKRLITSVDLKQERLEKLNNSRTLGPSKKMFKRTAKRKLKLNLKKLNKSIEEVPTVEKELAEIIEDAGK